MAGTDKTVPGLPASTTVAGTDLVITDTGSQTRKTTVAQLLSSNLFTQTGTGAVARSINSKFGDIVSVKDFNAKGDGITDDTAAIQAAITAVTEGGTILFPTSSGHYLYSQLTIAKTVTFLGHGWHCPTLGIFGDTGYTSSTTGSVLRSTKTTSGNSIVSQTINKGPRFKNIAILGPGSGTSTGIGFGDGSDYQVLGKWDDVLIANFDKGLQLTNVEDYEFSSLRVRGCQTYGILLQSGIAGTNTNQNVFVNLELQKNGIGLSVTEASTEMFYGGLIQGNTTGIKLTPSASGRIGALYFDGMWSETNTTPIAIDLTSGGISHLSFTRMTIQETSNLFSLTNPNNNTVSHLSLNNNSASGITADFSPGASIGPAYSLIEGQGNDFTAITRSNATFESFYDNVRSRQLGSPFAKVWCQFDGTPAGPTLTPASSFNVTSITKNGTGDYTINFTNAMPDANYSVSASARAFGLFNGPMLDIKSVATGNCNVRVFNITPALADSNLISVIIFGN